MPFPTGEVVRAAFLQEHGIALSTEDGNTWETFDTEADARAWSASKNDPPLYEYVGPKLMKFQGVKQHDDFCFSALPLDGLAARALSATKGLWLKVEPGLPLGMRTFTQSAETPWQHAARIKAPVALVERLLRHSGAPGVAGQTLESVRGTPFSFDNKHPGWTGQATFAARDGTKTDVRWRTQVLSLHLIVWAPDAPGRVPLQRLVAQLNRYQLPKEALRYL